MSKSQAAQIEALSQGLLLANSALIQVLAALSDLDAPLIVGAEDDFRHRLILLDESIAKMQEIIADLSENVD